MMFSTQLYSTDLDFKREEQDLGGRWRLQGHWIIYNN